MKKLIAFALLLALIPAAIADTLSYSVYLHYSGSLTLKSIELVGVASPPPSDTGAYVARIVSHKGQILYQTAFNLDTQRYYSLPIGKQATPTPAKNTSINLLLPYYPNAGNISVLRGNEELLTIDASQFSICNENSACDGTETLDTCADCTCGNGVCEETYQTCSQDCRAESTQTGSNTAKYLSLAGTVLIFAALTALLIRGRKKRTKR